MQVGDSMSPVIAEMCFALRERQVDSTTIGSAGAGRDDG
jgi:hypothetical protein